MSVEIYMPKAGAMMNEATIVEWIKKVGESVTEGEVLIKIEAEKATMEIEAPASGVLEEILVQEDQVAPVGAVLGRIRG